MNKPIIAIMYDFDKTLAVTDMQNFSFIPRLNLTPQEFWGETEVIRTKFDMDKILSYMYTMILECRKRNIPLTREYLNSCSEGIKYFDGITTWFERINDYAEKNDVIVEHYIISSGNSEIIEKCSIAKYFTKIFGCEFIYDDVTKEAVWPKTIVNYTLKTQYIFRINKGVTQDNDDKAVNEKQKEKRVPFANMIYIGDGLTDVPSMIMVKENFGTSIAVYPNGQRDKVNSLFEDDRVNYICKADYSKGSEIETIVKLLIDTIGVRSKLEHKQEKIKKLL